MLQIYSFKKGESIAEMAEAAAPPRKEIRSRLNRVYSKWNACVGMLKQIKMLSDTEIAKLRY